MIVGRLDGAVAPPYHVTVTLNIPSFAARLHRFVAGRRYPRWMIKRAQSELDGFIRILEDEGVSVRRPDIVNHRAAGSYRVWRDKQIPPTSIEEKESWALRFSTNESVIDHVASQLNEKRGPPSREQAGLKHPTAYRWVCWSHQQRGALDSRAGSRLDARMAGACLVCGLV